MSVTGIVESEYLMTSPVRDVGERTTEAPNNELFGSSDCNQTHAFSGEGIVSPFDRNRLTGCNALPHGVSRPLMFWKFPRKLGLAPIGLKGSR